MTVMKKQNTIQEITLNITFYPPFWIKDNKLAGSISLIDCTVNDLPMENGEYRFEVLSKTV